MESARESLVDFELAAATAARLAGRSASLPLATAVAAHRDLTEAAVRAEEHVAAYTGLYPPVQGRAAVAVVDRPEWARAAAAGMERLAGPALARLESRRAERRAAGGPARWLGGTVGPIADRAGALQLAAARRAAGVQTGAVLAWLATKVLGQYEIATPGQTGRLLLVAPNIVAAELALDLDPADFRLWVCLHEETHRVQFEGVPWLRDHLASELETALTALDLDLASLIGRLREVIANRGASPGQDRPRRVPGMGLLGLVATPEQREVLGRLQALMTLLEGHADQVMDAVGPQVVPSVAVIRERFERRRGGGGPVDRLVRQLLGMDAKIEQYRAGGKFVRQVVERVGVEGFSAVWSEPAALPTSAELAEPARWLTRVTGLPADRTG